MRKSTLQVAAIAAGLLVVVAGCTGLDTAADPNLTSPSAGTGKASKASKGKAQDDGLLTVTYKISGSANRGMITYTTPSGQEQTTRNLPWKKSFKVEQGTGEFLSISVQNEGASGDVVCQIVVAGKLVKRARSTGAYAIASCDHSLGF